MAEIAVSHLTKAFGSRKALDDISFELPAGGFLSVFGPNGAGKSTLMRILSTVLAPSAGEVRVGGISPRDDSEAVRKRIGLIAHSSLLYPDMSAAENLQFYARLYDVADAPARITELLDRLELSHRRFDLVRAFSRGMLQRLSIARALIHRPSILFLDEPYTGLDPHAVDILDGLIESIRSEHTFIMVTHGLEKGLALCDAALILDKGRIVYHKSKAEIDSRDFARVYRDVVREEESA